MLKQARQHAKNAGVRVELIQSDGMSIGLEDESVDLVILVHVFHEIEDKDRVLREFSRLLKSSGRLIIVERTRANGFLARKFGPPVIEHGDVMHAITQVGFAVIEVVQNGEDSIFIAGTKR